MEENNKKIYSTLLMMVGALFIVISGGIFVSQTWHYLPELVKKLCLVVVSGGFFAGSYFVGKSSKLRKTPSLLYYLGVCFLGFATLSFLNPGWLNLSEKLTVVLLIMSVPVAMHFLRCRGMVDFLFQMLLADGMVVCVSQYSIEKAGCAATVSITLVTMLLAGFVYYCRRELPGEEKLAGMAEIACWVHMIVSMPWLICYMLTENNFFYSVLPAMLLTAALTVLQVSNRSRVYRILQSLALFLCSLTLVSFFVETILGYGGKDLTELEFFIAFFGNLVWMVLLDRKEMLVTNGLCAFTFTLCQIAAYHNICHADGEMVVCYPFALCMGVAVLLLKYFRHPDEAWQGVIRNAAGWLLLGLHAMVCWLSGKYCVNYGVAFWFALVFLQLSLFRGEEPILKALLRSFSTIIVLGALCANEIVPTRFYRKEDLTLIADFGVEYTCLVMGLGIVLLGKICYDVFHKVRLFQFIGTCILLWVLVCNNLAHPALPNVLFLGIGTLAMLVLSTIFKKKTYALASAITLIFVVLYLTREVWMSIAWWVYLFVAGVGLVIYAIRRERAE